MNRNLLKNKMYTIITDLYIKHLKKGEIKKFKDPKRVKIYENIKLTEKQEKEIDDLYTKYYGKKIPHTWHRHFMAFTGNFDAKYFPELLFIPEFEFFKNQRREYAKVLEDKNFLPMIAHKAQIKMPKVYIECSNGIIKNADGKVLKNNSDVINYLQGIEAFIKPSIDSSSGQGCSLINFDGKKDSDGNLISLRKVDELGSNYVIQEKIVCHDSLRKIYPNSVNTFRIITYKLDNDFYYCPIILRIGQGGAVVDNAHAGGMFIAVEDDGTLHETAFTEFNEQYTLHPDSEIVFEGYIIPHVKEIIRDAIKMHSYIPQLGCINWDFTIDETGEPVLIEANILGGSIWLSQIAHGKGPFGDNTEKILQWISEMENKTYYERKNL